MAFAAVHHNTVAPDPRTSAPDVEAGTAVAAAVTVAPVAPAPTAGAPQADQLYRLFVAAGRVPMYGPVDRLLRCERGSCEAAVPAEHNEMSYLAAHPSDQVVLFCEGDGRIAAVSWVAVGRVQPRPELSLAPVPLGTLQQVPLKGMPLLAVLFSGTGEVLAAPPSLAANLMRVAAHPRVMNARWGKNRHFAMTRRGCPRDCDDLAMPPGLTVYVDPDTLHAEVVSSSLMLVDATMVRCASLAVAALLAAAACSALGTALEQPALLAGYFVSVVGIVVFLVRIQAAGETDTRDVIFV